MRCAHNVPKLCPPCAPAIFLLFAMALILTVRSCAPTGCLMTFGPALNRSLLLSLHHDLRSIDGFSTLLFTNHDCAQHVPKPKTSRVQLPGETASSFNPARFQIAHTHCIPDSHIVRLSSINLPAPLFHDRDASRCLYLSRYLGQPHLFLVVFLPSGGINGT